MSNFSRILQYPLALFRSSVPVPQELRGYFRNLYGDIAWYGVLNGTILPFLSIYLARIGADGSQIGLLNAVPAVTSLVFTLPAGKWLQHHPIRGSVFLTSLGQRIFYLPLIFIPILLANPAQIWTVILLTLLMSIPGTALVIGFNSMFADLVPPTWRGYVAGIRNSLFSIVSTVVTLLTGWILVALAFPFGYQLVFALGFGGSLMSSYNLYRIAAKDRSEGSGISLMKWLKSRRSIPRKLPLQALSLSTLNLEVVKSPFGKILMLLFFFHLVQYLAIPIFPLYWVNDLRFSDQIISVGQAIFSLAVFVGSTQLDRISRATGNHRLFGLGIIAMGTYPFIMGFVREVGLYIFASIAGGLAWSMVGGVIYNYIYEKIPTEGRSVYISWYNLVLNAAILIGSLAGPLIAEIGPDLYLILILFGLLRAAAGSAILLWG